MKDVLTHEDLAVGSYRFAVSRLIPQMTQVALQTHKKDLMRETPNFAKRKFLYRLSRSDYEKEWGKDYAKTGFMTRVYAVFLRYTPKIGPFKAMAFNNPTPDTENKYFKSINMTVDQYRAHLEEVRAQKKMGEDDPALLEEIGKAKLSLEEKYDALFSELKSEWKKWDAAVDGGTEEELVKIRNRMVDVLNRRNYIRNLVRDVNEALE